MQRPSIQQHRTEFKPRVQLLVPVRRASISALTTSEFRNVRRLSAEVNRSKLAMLRYQKNTTTALEKRIMGVRKVIAQASPYKATISLAEGRTINLKNRAYQLSRPSWTKTSWS